jgi:hypothetical protein
MYNNIFRLFSLILLTLSLTACGGGGDGDSSSSSGNNCGTVVDFGPSSMVNGMLEAGDCMLSDLDPTSGDTSFADEYRLTLSSPATMTITMRSNTLDSFLLLLGRSTTCASGCTLAQSMFITSDDDSGVGTTGFDSQIIIALNAGSYMIVANSIFAGSGNYTLETSF